MSRRAAGTAIALALLIASAARADVDPSEYGTRSSLRSEAERQRLQRELSRERAVEAGRDAERRAEAAGRLAAEQARLEGRPWPVRLTEARCTACHPATNYSLADHALPGWWMVALRMRFMNDAPVTWGEMRIIARHLAETYPARRETALIEWGLAGGALAAGTWLTLRRRRRAMQSSDKES
ncbi:MAG: hypothetical protein JNK22_01075 [Rhodocyclaceae bacterium]|nr:hypothetical protein [Rhodocyclaceae bacterium]